MSFETPEINPELPGIIILSHGPLSTALVESAKLLCGEQQNLTAFPLKEGCDIEQYQADFLSAYERMPQGTVILMDFLGGTPFNLFAEYAMEHGVPGITGVNLPMLTEAINLRMVMSGRKLVERLLEVSREGIVDCLTFFEEVDA